MDINNGRDYTKGKMDNLTDEQVKLIEQVVAEEIKKSLQPIIEKINETLDRINGNQRKMIRDLSDLCSRVETAGRVARYTYVDLPPIVDDTVNGKPRSPFAQ